jgi:hypothetical protein
MNTNNSIQASQMMQYNLSRLGGIKFYQFCNLALDKLSIHHTSFKFQYHIHIHIKYQIAYISIQLILEPFEGFQTIQAIQALQFKPLIQLK